MTRFKKVIVRISVFLLLLLLSATVLSKTVYRLLLPQVREAYVNSAGALDNSLTFKAVVGHQIIEQNGEKSQSEDSPAEATPKNPQYAVDLSMTFYEIQTLFTRGSSLSATAEHVRNPIPDPVTIGTSGYDYDSASDSYILHCYVQSQGKLPLETGSPLTITVNHPIYLYPYFVPLNSVYTELVAGVPQYYVYALVDRQTMWGRITFVQKKVVTMGGSDYKEAQITFAGEAPQRVACYPSRPLQDGDAVKALAES